jgi:hypothetical protein
MGPAWVPGAGGGSAASAPLADAVAFSKAWSVRMGFATVCLLRAAGGAA